MSGLKLPCPKCRRTMDYDRAIDPRIPANVATIRIICDRVMTATSILKHSSTSMDRRSFPPLLRLGGRIMSEMIERVAKALRKYSTGSEDGWAYETGNAYAAIEAMREPFPARQLLG
jgi:hypothetical protein